MRRISIEEHFFTEEYLEYLYSRKDCPRYETAEDEKQRKITRIWETASFPPSVVGPDRLNRSAKLVDLGEGRLKDMDEAGIDMAVLSLGNPGVDAFDEPDGSTWAKKTNDELAGAVRRYPKRFAGLAALAPKDPLGAADELNRAVTELGLKGALINSHIQGEYLDDKRFWVIFETAERLGVPLYIHPRWPSADMLKLYQPYPGLHRAMWGFGAETGLHAMRLIMSGLFDRYPGLKIVLGHLGEALPFWLWRMDNKCPPSLRQRIQRNPSDYVKTNFFVTTSGMFSRPPFLCTYMSLGAESILFATDYPFEPVEEAVDFMDSVPICEDDKEKIYHLNAEKLFAL